MFLIVAASAAAVVHPQVHSCAAAVRTDSDAALEACSSPKVELWDDAEIEISQACLRAMAAGRDTRKVPDRIRWTMLEQFEAAMESCENPRTEIPTLKRDTVDLWD